MCCFYMLGENPRSSFQLSNLGHFRLKFRYFSEDSAGFLKFSNFQNLWESLENLGKSGILEKVQNLWESLETWPRFQKFWKIFRLFSFFLISKSPLLWLCSRFTHIVKTSWRIHHYLLYNFYYMFKYKGGSLPIGGVIRPRVWKNNKNLAIYGQFTTFN